ncbi:YncE family protein [Rhodoferax sp. WC2427]|uniref:YncE family protein n=1 Tax=Rhodoferax sp. WC2427 TaxID=3234144 RepID=UPI003465A130
MSLFKMFSVAAAVAVVAGASMPAAAFDGWHLDNATAIPGKGSAWDYVSLDAGRGHLFIGRRGAGLQVYDIATHKAIAVVGSTASDSSNGATLMPEFDLGISYNENGTITPFKLSTLEAQPSVKLGEELDATHYDPSTQRIVVNMAAGKDGTELLVLQAPSLKQVGSIKVSTKKPEHAEADGQGNFYMASRDENAVYRINTKDMVVTAQWPTPGCAQTNGLALDAAHHRIFLGCRGSATVKPSFAVMDADNGAILYTAEIGGGNDEVVYDASLKRVFLANGVNAVLNVFEQVDANTYKPLEALGTQAGVRTMAMDHGSKKIYAITAEGSADYAKKITTSVSPYYANTFFDDKFYVLTYSK